MGNRKMTSTIVPAVMPQTTRKRTPPQVAVHSRTVIPERVAAYIRLGGGGEAHVSMGVLQQYYIQMYGVREGYELVGIYIDIGYSGNDMNRPEFKRLMADCRAGKITKVVTKSISRFCRNITNAIQIIDELRDLNVSVLFELENIDTASAQGDLFLAALGIYELANEDCIREG